MSTNLLYHGFGVRGYNYIKSKYESGAVTFTLEPRAFELQCSSCNSRNVIRRGKVDRQFRSLPIGRKPVWFSLALQRIECMACGLVRQVKIADLLILAEPIQGHLSVTLSIYPDI